MKNFFKKILDFFRKYGIDAVIALAIFNFPIYARAFITGPDFINFSNWWTAIWWGLGPLTPGWLFTVLLAVFIRWLRTGAWQLILLIREAAVKLQLQNQLSLYLTSEEINMILEMAKKVTAESDNQRKKFNADLRKKRLKMIDDQWTKQTEKKE